MPRIPTQVIQNLVARCEVAKPQYGESAIVRNTEIGPWILSKRTDNDSVSEYTLFHYGTPILKAWKGPQWTDASTVEYSRKASASDRDGANSLFQCLNMGRYRVTNRGGKLQLV